jgi:hypothetical protein
MKGFVEGEDAFLPVRRDDAPKNWCCGLLGHLLPVGGAPLKTHGEYGFPASGERRGSLSLHYRRRTVAWCYLRFAINIGLRLRVG